MLKLEVQLWYETYFMVPTLYQQFTEKGYKENIIQNQIKKLDNLERSALLNNANTVWKNVIQFSVRYSPILPNIRSVITKYWHLLKGSVRNL